MIISKEIFRYYKTSDNLTFDKKDRVHVVGVIFDKPLIDLNPSGEFVEYKLYVYQDLTCFVSVTIVCNLRAECIPRLQFMTHAVGKTVVIQNLEVEDNNRLFVDTRKPNRFRIGVLNLTRFRSLLDPFVSEVQGFEKPIPLDPPYSMNMNVDSFPNSYTEIESFRKIAKFVRRCQRNVNLVKINPSLAQRSNDFETKYICAKLIVSYF